MYSPPDRSGDTPATKRKVLIVEDNLVLAMEIELALIASGYEVIGVAESAAQAFELAREDKPDLAIMDIRLPGDMDGLDTAASLFEHFGTRSIFASAHSVAEMRTRAGSAAAAGWLVKPYTMADLVGAVHTALGKPSN